MLDLSLSPPPIMFPNRLRFPDDDEEDENADVCASQFPMPATSSLLNAGRDSYEAFVVSRSRVLRLFNLPTNPSAALASLFSPSFSSTPPPITMWALREECGGPSPGKEDSIWAVFRTHDEAKAALSLVGGSVTISTALERDLEPFSKLRKFEILSNGNMNVNTIQHPPPPPLTPSHPNRVQLPPYLALPHSNSSSPVHAQSHLHGHAQISTQYPSTTRPNSTHITHLRSSISTPDLRSQIHTHRLQAHLRSQLSHSSHFNQGPLAPGYHLSTNPPDKAIQFRAGDWVCGGPNGESEGCGAHNFMRNERCIGCSAARPLSPMTSHHANVHSNLNHNANRDINLNLNQQYSDRTSVGTYRNSAVGGGLAGDSMIGMGYPATATTAAQLQSLGYTSAVQHGLQGFGHGHATSLSSPRFRALAQSQVQVPTQQIQTQMQRISPPPAMRSTSMNHIPSSVLNGLTSITTSHAMPHIPSYTTRSYIPSLPSSTSISLPSSPITHAHSHPHLHHHSHPSQTANHSNPNPLVTTSNILTPSGRALAIGGKVQNVSRIPLAPCVMWWPDNEPFPEEGQVRPAICGSQPPIMNTGNRGPIEHQPGDWICGKCHYLNWRRRKVCGTCFPYAEGNLDGVSPAVQAERIALLTAVLARAQVQQQVQDVYGVGGGAGVGVGGYEPSSPTSFRSVSGASSASEEEWAALSDAGAGNPNSGAGVGMGTRGWGSTIPPTSAQQQQQRPYHYAGPGGQGRVQISTATMQNHNSLSRQSSLEMLPSPLDLRMRALERERDVSDTSGVGNGGTGGISPTTTTTTSSTTTHRPLPFTQGYGTPPSLQPQLPRARTQPQPLQNSQVDSPGMTPSTTTGSGSGSGSGTDSSFSSPSTYWWNGSANQTSNTTHSNLSFSPMQRGVDAASGDDASHLPLLPSFLSDELHSPFSYSRALDLHARDGDAEFGADEQYLSTGNIGERRHHVQLFPTPPTTAGQAFDLGRRKSSGSGSSVIASEQSPPIGSQRDLEDGWTSHKPIGEERRRLTQQRMQNGRVLLSDLSDQDELPDIANLTIRGRNRV